MAPAVLVFARFDTDSVVAHIKGAPGEDDVLASVDIDAVAVGRVMRIADGNAADHDVPAIQRVKVPAGRVLEGAVFDQHAAAFAQ